MMIDKIKLVFSLLLVGFGVTGFYLLEEKQTMVVRILAVLVGLIAASVLLSTTQSGKEFFAFSRDAVAEAKRVVWPSRRETIQTTLAVFVLVVVMAIFMWIVDVGFLNLVKALMSRGA
jgi:preprotein translocase subunit SecE